MADNEARRVFAENLRVLMDHAKNCGVEELAKRGTAMGLETISGVSDSAINRYREGVVSPSLDHIARIARAFTLQPWELLYPNLDPANPPAVTSADRMKELQEVLSRAAKLFAQEEQEGATESRYDDGEGHRSIVDSTVSGTSKTRRSPRRGRH